ARPWRPPTPAPVRGRGRARPSAPHPAGRRACRAARSLPQATMAAVPSASWWALSRRNSSAGGDQPRRYLLGVDLESARREPGLERLDLLDVDLGAARGEL